jgi:hypothetical protein
LWAFQRTDSLHLENLRLTAESLGKLPAFTDPFLIEKVRDVVGLYASPPQNALVLCVDEKSHIQALERSQPIFSFGAKSAGAIQQRLLSSSDTR